MNNRKVETRNPFPLNKKIPINSSKNGKFKLIGLIILILLFGFYIGLYGLSTLRPLNYKVALKQKQVHISTKVPNRIEEFYVTDGQPVKKDRLCSFC